MSARRPHAAVRWAWALVAAPLLALAPASASASTSAPSALHPDALLLLDTWLAAQQRYQRLPAVSVAVQQGSGPMWSRGYGAVDAKGKVPARGDSLYGICSISKVFTATAVMQQVEQGLYRLDDDMARLLPEAGLPAATAEHGALTVRSLLTHAGGLEREAPFAYWEPPAFRFPTREQLRAVQPKVVDAPRAHLHYSNYGIALLGELVERQGGLPFGEWVQQRLLTPLGLSDTRPFLPAGLHGTRLVQAWSAPDRDGRRQPVPRYEARALTPSAGFSSSVEDLVRFGQWHLGQTLPAEKAPVLSPASRREMQRLQFQDPADKRQRGLPWRLTDDEGERLVMHDGHCPGQLSELVLLPERQLVLALAVSANEPAWIDDSLGRGVRQVLRAPLAARMPQLAEYAGRYDESPWTSETWILPWGDQLLMFSLPSPNPVEGATRLQRVEGDAFRVQRADGSLGEWLRFERDAKGKVVRAVQSHQGMKRLTE